MAPELVGSAVRPTGGGPRPIGTVLCPAQGIPVEGGVKQPGLKQELCPTLGPILQVPRPCPDRLGPGGLLQVPTHRQTSRFGLPGNAVQGAPRGGQAESGPSLLQAPLLTPGPGWCPVAPEAHGAERLRWRGRGPLYVLAPPHSAHWLRGDLHPHHPVRPWAREPGATAAGGSPGAAGLGRGPCSHRAPGGARAGAPGPGPRGWWAVRGASSEAGQQWARQPVAEPREAQGQPRQPK